MITFSTVTIVIGLVYGLINVYAAANPEQYRQFALKAPRSMTLGCTLILISTAWFLYNVNAEKIADFASYKKLMLGGFGILGVGSCFYLKDHIGARGLAIFLLLLAKLVCDTGRWVESPLRLIMITWAYVWVFVGMWWTVSPYRMRDWIEWNVGDSGRLRLLSGIRALFGFILVGLGATVFRG
ncbi:MAG: hypothetical protein ISQ14_06385 [Verrucomicrobiae bacterium]|jgi:hypothetical protein|nr:hypothetical protein [Verrucomicrobiae bacterium]